MKLPNHLFKFSGPTRYALQNLENGQIYCQHYAAYNDPFEFWTTISTGIPDADREPTRYLSALRAWGFDYDTISKAKSDPDIEGSVTEYFEECLHYAPDFEKMRQEVRISCFSAEAENLLMWSHYGDGLRGFCIVFDEDRLKCDETSIYIVDVAYRDAPPKVDSFIYGIAYDQDWYSHTAVRETEDAIKYQGWGGFSGEIEAYRQSGAEAFATMLEISQQVFATKPIQWEYERERRLLIVTDRSDTSPILLDYPTDAISEIIIGDRMEAEYRSQLLSIINERYPHVSIRTARRSLDAYTIAIE